MDLEYPSDVARLAAPKMLLGRMRGLVVLDEIQLPVNLLRLLRVLLDRQPLPARFLLQGSAAPEMVRGASETFVERDLRRLGFEMAPAAMRRFLTMMAHLHGQRWNASAVGSSLALSQNTVRRYLDLLSGAYLARQLHPWFENVGKRLVKSPKVYVRDSGLLHGLLGLERQRDVESHPGHGASWEGLCVEEIIAVHGERRCWYWATHGGAELDVLVLDRGRRIGYECKLTDSPRMTKSMHVVLADLKLDHLFIVYPGEERFPLAERVTATGLADIRRDVA